MGRKGTAAVKKKPARHIAVYESSTDEDVENHIPEQQEDQDSPVLRRSRRKKQNEQHPAVNGDEDEQDLDSNDDVKLVQSEEVKENQEPESTAQALPLPGHGRVPASVSHSQRDGGERQASLNYKAITNRALELSLFPSSKSTAHQDSLSTPAPESTTSNSQQVNHQRTKSTTATSRDQTLEEASTQASHGPAAQQAPAAKLEEAQPPEDSSNITHSPTITLQTSNRNPAMSQPGGAFIPPNQTRNMRACMVCSVVRTQQQFLTAGCPNCEDILELAGNPDAINDCTSQVFEGLISVADTTKSWVARYQRLQGYVPGVYATQVEGLLPEDVLVAVENAGINYVPRDGSEQEMIPKE